MTAPSNNDFRIAGALGISPDPTETAVEEVLTQGIGFPLRPISGVPDKADPPLDGGRVAIGAPTQWMGDWQQGKLYPQGAYVRDGDWTCIALNATFDKPAPVPDPLDPESYGIPAYTPIAQDNTSVVDSGHVYTISQDGWVKEVRIWVTELTANTNYRVIIENITDPQNPISSTIEEPVLAANQWTVISKLNRVIPAGTVLRIRIDALNSGANTNISGGWRYLGPTQTGAPGLQQWTHDNQRTTFRIDKVDLDSTNRSTELEGVIPESTISLVQTDNIANATLYRVVTVIDQGAYMEYGVVLLDETGGGVAVGATTTIDIAVPIPLPTQYAEETAVWGVLPSWASSVTGFLRYDGVDQAVPATNAYGVDILFEPARISTNWDIVAFSG